MTGINLSTASDIRIGGAQASRVYLGSYQIWPTRNYANDYLTFYSWENNNEITWRATHSTHTKTIEISIDNGTTWVSKTSSSTGTLLATLNAGDKMLVKGTNNGYSDEWGSWWNTFDSSQDFTIEGNIMSLIYGDNFIGQTTITTERTFAYLFQHTYSLKNAQNLILPSTTLTEGCYLCMFNYSNLLNAPVLPATTLSPDCYYHMFSGCDYLRYIKCLATDITATDCTYGWLDGAGRYQDQSLCLFIKNPNMTSWTTGTSGIPSGWTVLDDGQQHDYSQDYLTFVSLGDNNDIYFTYGSSSLTPKTIQVSTDNGSTWTNKTSSLSSSSPGPIATLNTGDKLLIKGTNEGYGGNGAKNNSNIFSCSNTTDGINVCGNIMSLIYGDNFIGQTTLSNKENFSYLFSGMTVINAENLILPATTITDSCYHYMFYRCTSLTTAPELPATILRNNCYRFMFNGCSSLTTAPKLPATTLAQNCYNYMFQGCTSLTTAPELPAPTLVTYCYRFMFNGCSSLIYIKCLATNISASGCLNSWVTNVAATGTFVKDPNMNDWTTGTSGIPSGWTIQNA